MVSYDRYRTVLKGTWKDHPRPANGLMYDLGAHLIDQVLLLFGRPEKITATIRNLRAIGDPNVDDDVSAQFDREIVFQVDHESGICSSLSSCTMRRGQHQKELFSHPP